MSEQGVPVDEVTAKDFIMVRAALVQRLGGANEALVWSRIEFRSGSVKHAHETDDGQLWWAASKPIIAEETGLSIGQVKLALEHLVEDGFLLAEQHHGSDRTMSYSPVILHRLESADGIVPSAGMSRSIGSIEPFQGLDIADAPSIETSEEVEEAPVVPAGPTAEELFEVAWSHWPKRSEKKLSRERFLRVLPKHPTLVNEIVMFGDAYSQTTEVQFVPALAVWINRERWTDDLPAARGGRGETPTDRARAIIALGAEPQQAVSA